MTPQITDSTLLVPPDKATAQRAADLAATQTATEAVAEGAGLANDGTVFDGGGGGQQEGAGDGRVTPAPPDPPQKTRYYGVKDLSAERYASDFKKLAEEILAPLLATPGVDLNITVEIHARTDGGFDDVKIRTVSENAATLKFGQSSFESQ